MARVYPITATDATNSGFQPPQPLVAGRKSSHLRAARGPPEVPHCGRVLSLGSGRLADDDRREGPFGDQLHQRPGFGAESKGLRKGQMAFFPAFAELDPGKMGVKAAAPFLSQPVPDGVEHGGEIRLPREAAQGTGV